MALLREIKILSYIRRHTAVTRKQLTKRFPDIDEYYTRLEKEYIREDKAENIYLKCDLIKKSIPDDEPIISLTIYGDDVVMRHKHEFWAFVLPYSITTIIAASSVILEIINFVLSHCQKGVP